MPGLKGAIGLSTILVAGVMSVSIASAGDRVHADTAGNLIVESDAGYKRILVGKGHMAAELARYLDADTPQIAPPATHRHKERQAEGCRRQGVLLKGRAYMYGLGDGELPVLVGPCL